MNKNLSKILKYTLFPLIGIFIFLWVYKSYDLKNFGKTLSELKWEWVILSLVLALFSHLSRAMRWNMLIKTMGHSPKIVNTFLSVIIMYATNLIIPRGGEIARCTTLSQYEKIPIAKLLGTVVTERAIDVLILFFMLIFTIFLQIGVFKEFLTNNPEFGEKLNFLFSAQFWIIATLAGLVFLFLIWKYRHKIMKIKWIARFFNLFFNFFEGIKSIRHLKNPIGFIAHSLFIYVMYFFMFYVVFFSYLPTKDMSYLSAFTTFIMGSLAMLAPVQGGLGAWHFMVIETLFLFGLDKEFGRNLALISHTSMNLMLLIVGAIAFFLLPIINKQSKKNSSLTQEKENKN